MRWEFLASPSQTRLQLVRVPLVVIRNLPGIQWWIVAMSRREAGDLEPSREACPVCRSPYSSASHPFTPYVLGHSAVFIPSTARYTRKKLWASLSPSHTVDVCWHYSGDTTFLARWSSEMDSSATCMRIHKGAAVCGSWVVKSYPERWQSKGCLFSFEILEKLADA
jgi:hypothetical protein